MKENDLSKLRHIQKQLELAQKLAVKVGVPADVGHYPKTGQTIAEVGTMHEFGLGVPRRSFLRMSFEMQKKQLEKALDLGLKSVLNGGDIVINLNKVGLLAQNISKSAFKTGGFGKWKALSKETIAEKGSSKILVDTARLVQSITFWVVKDTE